MILGLLFAVVTAQYADGAPFIQVKLKGSPRLLWFTIDSGSPFTFIDEKVAREIGLRPRAAESITGAGAGAVETKVVDDLKFEEPPLATSVRIADLSGLPALFNHPIDGFFGYDLLAAHVIVMNPRAKTVAFIDPKRFRYRGHGVILPFRFGGKRGKWIFVKGRLKVPGNPAEDTEFMVDSGSIDAVNHPLLRKSTAPLRRINTGSGLGTPFPGVAGTVEWVRFGDYVLHDVDASCCGAAVDRLIGQGVLSRFTTTYDYARKRLILERD